MSDSEVNGSGQAVGQTEDIKMKKTTLALVISIFTAGTLFSSLSQAEGPGNGPDRQWQQQGGHDNRGNGGGHDARSDRGGQDRHDARNVRGGPDRHDARNDRGGPDRHDARNDRGPSPQFHRVERDHFAWSGHDFRRGHPMPPRFRGDDYRVNDWRDRGLYEPPRGAHWAYVDGNYVLIAAATGIITAILLNGALSQ